MVSVSSLGKSKGLPQPNTQKMLNTVSGLSGALLYPGVPTCPQTPAKVQPSSPYPKALGGSWCASSSMVRTPLSPCFGDTRVPSPLEAAASCSPCLVWSHERQGAVQRAPGRQRWEKWEGTAPLAKAGQPGWARMGQAGLSPKSWSQPQPRHPRLQLTV